MKITLEELYSFIDTPFLSRGMVYFKEGLIELISIEPHQITAWVMGSRAYKVSLKRIGQKIEGCCTCPAFEDVNTCKHLASTGFAVIKHYVGEYAPSDAYFSKAAFFKCR